MHKSLPLTPMLAHPVGLEDTVLTGVFIYMHSLYVIAEKALVSMCICAGSSEFPKLVIGVAPITHLRMCVLKIVTLKGGHLMW